MNDQPAPGALRTAISAAVDRFQSGMLHSEKVDLVMEGLSGVCFTTPNPILEGVELREAYARVIQRLNTLATSLRGHDLPQCAAEARDIAETLKATPLIGLYQAEGERSPALIEVETEALDLIAESAKRDGLTISAWIGERMRDAAQRGLSLPGRDAGPKVYDRVWPLDCAGKLIAALSHYDPETPVHGAYHVEIDGKTQCRSRGITLSRERVDGREIRTGDESVPYSLVIWTQPDQREAALSPPISGDAEEQEAYEIGERDGYESAVQDIDMMTGGDGEYFASTLPGRGCPDAATMKARIAERFEALSTVQDGSVREALEPFAFADVPIAGNIVDDAYFMHDYVTGRWITIGQVRAVRAALSTLPQSPAPISGDAS